MTTNSYQPASIVGVGPHPEPWPRAKKYDRDLLAKGDRRNVIDKYRYWTNEAIVADLDKYRSRLHIAVENWQHDFNIGTIVRNANAFNVGTVHIIGRRQWNKRGAMVTNRYLHVMHHPDVSAFVDTMDHMSKMIIAVENVKVTKYLHDSKLPLDCVMVFGSESVGISQELLVRSSEVLAIEQFGSTRSVNVGVASGIAMYVYAQQHLMS